MANRLFKQFMYSLEKQPVALFGVFTMTSSTTFTSDTQGMTLSRTGTGAWSIQLQDRYRLTLNVNIGLQSATDKDIKPLIKTTLAQSTGIITFTTLAVAAPTDLATGDRIHITVFLRNSTK